MSVVLDKAKDLAEAIASSEEIETMRKHEITMGNDPEAIAIVQEFQTTQRALYEKQSNGTELTEEEKGQVKDIEAKMEANENIRNYLDAQLKFENLLQGVNFIISQAISGDQSQDGGCNCGSDCGSDGGCNSESGCGSDCGCN